MKDPIEAFEAGLSLPEGGFDRQKLAEAYFLTGGEPKTDECDRSSGGKGVSKEKSGERAGAQSIKASCAG